MTIFSRSLVWLTAWLAIQALAAGESASLIAPLEPLRPWLKTWKGEFRNSTPEKPQIDVARWERALNGQAIRVLHSINRGEYGGETLISWNEAKRSLVFHYFTTAGFLTTGTIEVRDRTLVTHEIVEGSAEGVEEVRATMKLQADGSLLTTSEYLKNGEWKPGHGIHYREDPSAEVVFR
jgi:hypothetical protein